MNSNTSRDIFGAEMIILPLSRLLLKHKQVLLPEFVFGSPEGGCQGYYRQPADCELLVGDKYVDQKNGVCVITDLCEDDLGAMAHEFRHHLQWLSDWTYDGVPLSWNDPDTYAANITEYFTTSRSEMDALLFERSVSSNDLNGYWYHLIRENHG